MGWRERRRQRRRGRGGDVAEGVGSLVEAGEALVMIWRVVTFPIRVLVRLLDGI